MAVFPDRIVLKNSTDTQAAIESAIGSGGTDAIVYGEVVIGRESGGAKLYTLDSTGAVVVIGGGAAALGDLTDVDLASTPPVNGNALLYNGVEWVPGTASTVGSLDDLTDVDLTTTAPVSGDYLKYNGSQWVVTATGAYDVAMDGGDFDTGLTDDTTTIFDQFPISIDAHSDVDTTTTPPTNGQALVWNGVDNWVPGTVAASVALNDLTDVAITAAATGEVLRYNGSAWVDAQLAYSDLSGTPTIPASIDDLADVDTTTAAPTVDQVLVWDGTNWVPGNQTGGSGGGGGAVQTSFVTETQTASSGVATFSGIGQSGQLVQVASTLDAWIVLYPTAALRTADAGRAYGADPAPGSGVLAEFYVTAGGTVLATPGTTYFNNDTTKANAIYAAVRDQAGAAVNSQVTLECFAAKETIGYRTTLTATTASLVNDAAGDLVFTETGKSGRFVSIATDRAAWVILYTSTAARTADAGRGIGTDPSPGSGVLAEVLTTGAETIKLTPTVGYFNDETVLSSELYAKVANKSGAASTVQVDLTVIPAEV